MNSETLSLLGSDLWAIEPTKLKALVDEVTAGLEVLRAFGPDAVTRGEPDDQTPADANGVRTIAISGPILPKTNRLLDMLGVAYTSAAQVQADVLDAAEDPAVDSIFLDVDSPGGAVGGITEAAAAIAAASAQKPVHAHTSTQMASAAYWLASQANTVSASPGALVGSIGVYSVVPDTSAAADRMGMKVHVLRSGPHKGTGTDGAEVTEAQLSALQESVDDVAGQFFAAVSAGRPSVDIAAVSGGQSWVAEKAHSKNLIDRVEGFGAAFGQTKPEAPAPASEEEQMSSELLQTVLAKLEALEAKASDAEAAREADRVARESDRKKQTIDAATAAGTIAPAMRAHVEAYAQNATPENLSAFIATLGGSGARPSAVGTTSSEERAEFVDKAEAKMCKQLGITAADLQKFEGIKGVRVSGEWVSEAN